MKELSAGCVDVEIKKCSESYNPIFKRKEISFFIENVSSSSPRLYDVRKSLAENNNAMEDAVFIVRLDSKAGANRTQAMAEIYDSPEDAKKIVPKYIQLRNESKRHEEKVGTKPTPKKKTDKKAEKKAEDKKKKTKS